MAKKTQKSQKQDFQLVKELEDLCVDILVHTENDREITLSGNGTNPSEASNVAWAILEILHGDARKWEQNNQERIRKRAAEMCKLYGWSG